MEARERWMPIVEEDDAMIDDISCLVVEFIRPMSEEDFAHAATASESKIGGGTISTPSDPMSEF
ncbi:MAG: hypothetical protein V2I33_21060 [Kangiellaceae bacterium]|nr:hypothetical protein [Kangiellaceae bacterium]